jgi:uncharacterized protein YjbJ (UPF0337 family)
MVDQADKDRVEGTVDKATGSVKETVGKATGNEQAQAEGTFDKVKGEVKEGMADARDKVDEMVDKIKR